MAALNEKEKKNNQRISLKLIVSIEGFFGLLNTDSKLQIFNLKFRFQHGGSQ